MSKIRWEKPSFDNGNTATIASLGVDGLALATVRVEHAFRKYEINVSMRRMVNAESIDDACSKSVEIMRELRDALNEALAPDVCADPGSTPWARLLLSVALYMTPGAGEVCFWRMEALDREVDEIFSVIGNKGMPLAAAQRLCEGASDSVGSGQCWHASYAALKTMNVEDHR